MSLELVIFILLILLFNTAFLLLYIINDIRTGHFRKLIEAKKEYKALRNKVEKVRKENMGEK